MKKKIIVGMAAGRRYENYFRWISQSSDIEIIKLGYENKNLDDIRQCQGLVLTGGEDVHPRFYNKASYVNEFGLDDLDEARDEFELKLMQHAQEQRMPVLGICRGLQLTNVYFGGTLVPDIPSFGHSDHSKFKEGEDRYHAVALDANTALAHVAGVMKGEINSAHHQSVDRAGEGLIISARSPDGVAEGLERKQPEGQPYLLLVQWHPERMTDSLSPLSKNIRENFLEHVRKQ